MPGIDSCAAHHRTLKDTFREARGTRHARAARLDPERSDTHQRRLAALDRSAPLARRHCATEDEPTPCRRPLDRRRAVRAE